MLRNRAIQVLYCSIIFNWLCAVAMFYGQIVLILDWRWYVTSITKLGQLRELLCRGLEGAVGQGYSFWSWDLTLT